jgi:hypothetical protein
MKSLLCALLYLLIFPFTAAAEGTVLVTIKLAKKAGVGVELPVKLEFPESCSSCEIVKDPTYARQNQREVILAMRIPPSTPLHLIVKTDGDDFRRVILETMDIPFHQSSDELTFTLPSQIADRVNSGEFQSHFYWPGVELRFEHADPARRAGDYASGNFPTTQRKAASNLEFGLLEAIRRLGLDHYVDDQNLGRLFLMGFDTNYPHGHNDSPPHFHLALWLSSYRAYGSLIPHFYLTSQGLIKNSVVTPYLWPIKPSEYQPNEPIIVTDTLARRVYSLTITPEGWLNISRFDGLQCSLRPVTKGFDGGVLVSCPDFPSVSVQVQDDIDAGELSESIDAQIVARFHYDVDTGFVLSP